MDLAAIVASINTSMVSAGNSGPDLRDRGRVRVRATELVNERLREHCLELLDQVQLAFRSVPGPGNCGVQHEELPKISH